MDKRRFTPTELEKVTDIMLKSIYAQMQSAARMMSEGTWKISEEDFDVINLEFKVSIALNGDLTNLKALTEVKTHVSDGPEASGGPDTPRA